VYRSHFVDLDAISISALVTFPMALADRLFVVSEVDRVALDEAFDLMATAILSEADRPTERSYIRPGAISPRYSPVI
jgi:hypothetical protein